LDLVIWLEQEAPHSRWKAPELAARQTLLSLPALPALLPELVPLFSPASAQLAPRMRRRSRGSIPASNPELEAEQRARARQAPVVQPAQALKKQAQHMALGLKRAAESQPLELPAPVLKLRVQRERLEQPVWEAAVEKMPASAQTALLAAWRVPAQLVQSPAE
jgi:hypothetical protein